MKVTMIFRLLKRVLGVRPREYAYWWAIGDWWDRIDLDLSPDDFLRAFAAAPEPVRNLVAAHCVISETMNGALPQFFYNSSGILAPEARQALQVVGLGESAVALHQAMLELGDPYPRDRERRIQLIEPLYSASLSDPDAAKLDRLIELTDAFLDGLGNGCRDFEPALARYAENTRAVP